MPHRDNEIHIAIAFDQNFLTPFYVLLTSIFFNTRNNSITFHVIAAGVEQKEKEKIIKYIKGNIGTIIFYEINNELIKDFVLPDNVHFSIATYYRLFFPSLVPQNLSKLLYIDTDTVVIGDLSELYEIGLKNPVGAAMDTAGVPVRTDLGLHSQADYFNAGVLLINLQLWREQNISENAINFINDFPEKIKWADQDALNAVLVDNWFKLDKRFNLTFYDIPAFLQKKNFNLFLKNKIIIHYTTEQKPWLTLCRNRLRFLYHYYLKKSPVTQQGKYTDLEWKNRLLYRYFKLRFKEFLIDHTIIFSQSKTPVQL